MNRPYRSFLVAILMMSFCAGLPAQRPMENLGRGVVAVRSNETDVFVSWRLLGLDPAGLGFNLYRSTGTGAPVKINPSVLTGGTNFTDSGADLSQNLAYFVRPVLNGVEQSASGSFVLSGNHAIEPIVRINLSPLPGTDYSTKFIWVGDLDGDGEYDFVIDRLAPFDPTNNDIGLGNQYLEAYKRDGTRLWQIDMGLGSRGTYNISPSAATLSMGMYDGATVYDLDNDGKAEVILKIADGVKFPDGSVFTNADTNKQFLAVIDGLTGRLIASKAFPTDFYTTAGKYGTQLGVGSLDGVTPTVFGWLRNRNADKSFNDIFVAWTWNGGTQITENWKWLNPNGVNGTASHQMRIVDVDGDGKDEFMTGSFCVNSNGTTRYSLDGVGHGDRFHVGKFDKSRPGLQGYGIQQNNTSLLWEYYYDATTGEVLWKHFGNAVADIGRGLVGDVDARKPGYEVWSVLGLYNGPSNTLAESNTKFQPYPTHSFWWDGDVMTEGLNDSKFEKWDPNNPTTTNMLPRLLTMSDYGAIISNHNPMFFGDIMGDWRTEVIAMNPGYTQLMIFTTNIPSTTRLYTMPHNPEYRSGMTTKGYMQSHYLDYYLGDGMTTPPQPNIRYAGVASGATYPGENAVIAGGVLIDTNHLGFRGTGFLNFPVNGGTAQFNAVNGGSGGTKTISIRYSNGGKTARTGNLVVNGVSQAITFPVTLDWDTWGLISATVNLGPGTANTIRFESNGQDLGNIDEITVP